MGASYVGLVYMMIQSLFLLRIVRASCQIPSMHQHVPQIMCTFVNKKKGKYLILVLYSFENIILKLILNQFSQNSVE